MRRRRRINVTIITVIVTKYAITMTRGDGMVRRGDSDDAVSPLLSLSGTEVDASGSGDVSYHTWRPCARLLP